MGIQATVVYDAASHAPLVVRSSTTNATTVARLADTIASFAEHVDTVREIATTPSDVCALWGGPPYITYVVVHKRFRVIVIWSEEPGELDVCYDVHYCVSTLQHAVVRNANALAQNDPDSLAAVYDAAGHALLGGDDDLADKDTIAADAALAVAAVAGDEKRGLRKFFNKTMRLVEGQPPPKSRALKRKGSRATVATTPVPEAGPLQLDTQPARLALPDQVFNWADFGGALTQGTPNPDISWVVELLQGDERRHAAAAPVIRDDTSISHRQSDVGSTDSRPMPMSPPPSLPPPISSAASSDIASLKSPAQPSQPTPSVVSAESAPPSRVTTPATNTAMSPAMGAPSPVAVSSSGNPASAAPSPAPVQYSPAPTASIPSQSVPLTPTPASSSIPARSLSSTPSMTQPTPQAPTPAPAPGQVPVPVAPQAARAASVPQIATTHEQPPLPPQMHTAPSGFRGRGDAGDDFNVSALGNIKDPTGVGVGGANGGGTASAASNDPIRGMMNGFAKTMQAGDFLGALRQVYGTLRALSTQPLRQRETQTCSNYVLALKIMHRVRTSRIPAAEAALLTMFMAELRHLLPMHRTAAMRTAIDKNLAVGNFGMAARWMRQMPDVQQKYAAKLQLCIQRGEINPHMPPTNKLCYNALVVLTPPYGKCDRCTAVYKPGLSGVQIGQKCPTCFVGNVLVNSTGASRNARLPAYSLPCAVLCCATLRYCPAVTFPLIPIAAALRCMTEGQEDGQGVRIAQTISPATAQAPTTEHRLPSTKHQPIKHQTPALHPEPDPGHRERAEMQPQPTRSTDGLGALAAVATALASPAVSGALPSAHPPLPPPPPPPPLAPGVNPRPIAPMPLPLAAPPQRPRAVTVINPIPPPKPKQRRYRASPDQLRQLVQTFESTPSPTAPELAALAQRINMPTQSVVLWFKNRRARVPHKKAEKERKITAARMERARRAAADGAVAALAMADMSMSRRQAMLLPALVQNHTTNPIPAHTQYQQALPHQVQPPTTLAPRPASTPTSAPHLVPGNLATLCSVAQQSDPVQQSLHHHVSPPAPSSVPTPAPAPASMSTQQQPPPLPPPPPLPNHVPNSTSWSLPTGTHAYHQHHVERVPQPPPLPPVPAPVQRYEPQIVPAIHPQAHHHLRHTHAQALVQPQTQPQPPPLRPMRLSLPSKDFEARRSAAALAQMAASASTTHTHSSAATQSSASEPPPPPSSASSIVQSTPRRPRASTNPSRAHGKLPYRVGDRIEVMTNDEGDVPAWIPAQIIAYVLGQFDQRSGTNSDASGNGTAKRPNMDSNNNQSNIPTNDSESSPRTVQSPIATAAANKPGSQVRYLALHDGKELDVAASDIRPPPPRPETGSWCPQVGRAIDAFVSTKWMVGVVKTYSTMKGWLITFQTMETLWIKPEAVRPHQVWDGTKWSTVYTPPRSVDNQTTPLPTPRSVEAHVIKTQQVATQINRNQSSPQLQLPPPPPPPAPTHQDEDDNDNASSGSTRDRDRDREREKRSRGRKRKAEENHPRRSSRKRTPKSFDNHLMV